MELKVIFLDIDGVLNHAGCKVKTPRGFNFVEDEFIDRLKRIISATGAKVVLSSTWRKGYFDIEQGEHTKDAIDYVLLKERLLKAGIDIYDHTPLLKEVHRGREIVAWLQRTNIKVDAMVILDDVAEEKITPLEKYLVKTDYVTGLRERHVIRAIQKLNNVSSFVT